MSEPIKVRTTPMLLSPFVSIGREFGDLFRNPTALIGGFLGSGAFIGGVVAFALFGPTFEASAAEEDEELDMEFMPGELMRKGEQMNPEDIPEKIIVEETVAAEAKEEAKVTTDEKALPNPEPKKNDKPKEDVKATEKPDPNKGKDVKVSDKNRDSNTPYKDLPTVKDLPGNPFGDANGWSDMAKDGDPWATAVMGALNGMKVGAYAGQGSPANYQFQLVICADGSIDDVRSKGGTADKQLQDAIRNSLEMLKLPKAPADIAKQLGGKCKKIPYVFTWSGKGQSGKVK